MEIYLSHTCKFTCKWNWLINFSSHIIRYSNPKVMVTKGLRNIKAVDTLQTPFIARLIQYFTSSFVEPWWFWKQKVKVTTGFHKEKHRHPLQRDAYRLVESLLTLSDRIYLYLLYMYVQIYLCLLSSLRIFILSTYVINIMPYHTCIFR